MQYLVKDDPEVAALTLLPQLLIVFKPFGPEITVNQR